MVMAIHPPHSRPQRTVHSTRIVLVALTASILLALGGCKVDNPDFNPDPDPCLEGQETAVMIPAFQNPSAVDVLFVINNSPGTDVLQQRISTAMPRFISLLRNARVVRLVGVISGDMRNPDTAGALAVGGQGIAGCENTPRIIGIADESRAETFAACNVLLGQDGYSVQEPLQAAVTALTTRASQPAAAGGNSGFLRPQARLLIVVASLRDDCSHMGPEITASNPGGAISVCASNFDRLTPVEDLIDELQALKNSPNAVSVAVLAGPDDGQTSPDPDNLEPSCLTNQLLRGFSSRRLIETADLLAPNSEFDSVCSTSYSSSLSRFASLASPQPLVVCSQAEITSPPNTVRLLTGDDGRFLRPGLGGYLYLGNTDQCPNGAIQINPNLLDSQEQNLEVRFCSE